MYRMSSLKSLSVVPTRADRIAVVLLIVGRAQHNVAQRCQRVFAADAPGLRVHRSAAEQSFPVPRSKRAMITVPVLM